MPLTTLTFGCRLNAAETRVMQARAGEAGLADAVLVNTCAVTAEAVRQARQAIRKARREHPGKRIVVSGCAAQIEPETFAAMPEVDRVLGNADKLTAEAYRFAAGDAPLLEAAGAVPPREKVRVSDIFAVGANAPHMLDAFAPPGDETSEETGDAARRVRAFVEVQNGCDHRCTFCIIPYGRGDARSVPMGAVVDAIRRRVDRGIQEVVLTGVDLTSYGADLPGRPRLGKLVRAVLRHVPELPRLRLSSIDSVEADAELIAAIAEEERLMPHLHLSLQSGDDMILKRMKRRHARADAVRFCEEMRRARPGIVLGADLIAGFPTETDAMFQSTLSLVEACGLSLLHVFPFSPRQGTPAARMPQVPRHVAQARATTLRQAGHAALLRRLAAEPGKRRKILVERPGFGRSEHYLPVSIAGGRRGDIVAARIEGVGDNVLNAQAIQEAA